MRWKNESKECYFNCRKGKWHTAIVYKVSVALCSQHPVFPVSHYVRKIYTYKKKNLRGSQILLIFCKWSIAVLCLLAIIETTRYRPNNIWWNVFKTPKYILDNVTSFQSDHQKAQKRSNNYVISCSFKEMTRIFRKKQYFVGDVLRQTILRAND